MRFPITRAAQWPRFIGAFVTATSPRAVLVAVCQLIAGAVHPAVYGQERASTDVREGAAATEQQSPEVNWDEELTPGQVEEALRGLARRMREKWLLLDARPFDLEAAVETELRGAATGLKRFELELAIQRVIARGCDGHASSGQIGQAMLHSSGRCRLSFLIVPVGDRFVATKSWSRKRSQLWKDELPYITKLDGVPVERWIKQAERYVSQTNPLTHRSMAALQLCCLGHFRKELGLPDSDRIRVTLQAEDGAETVVDMPFPEVPASPFPLLAYSQYRQTEKDNPIPDWRVLEGNIGYLNLPSASGRTMQAIVDAMPAMHGVDGLIIDLRSNAGGSPEFALMLAQVLTTPEHPRTVGAFSWSPFRSSDNCPGYTFDEPGLSPEGQTLLREAWKRLDHAPWRPTAHLKATPRAFLLTTWKVERGIAPYNKPELAPLFESLGMRPFKRKVVVLIDRFTFSAGEIGAAMLQALPNVVLMGEQTRGGVGVANTTERERDPLTIPLAFEPHFTTHAVFVDSLGNPIEGRGVVPDIVHSIDLATISGPVDTMAEKAREHLTQQ
jgi:hypothetical protein